MLKPKLTVGKIVMQSQFVPHQGPSLEICSLERKTQTLQGSDLTQEIDRVTTHQTELKKLKCSVSIYTEHSDYSFLWAFLHSLKTGNLTLTLQPENNRGIFQGFSLAQEETPKLLNIKQQKKKKAVTSPKSLVQSQHSLPK